MATENEVFKTAGWNFVGDDRQIEAILRDLPAHAPLVVRNRLANVLATVAGLNDLGRLDPWEPLPLRVHVPENALAEPALGLGDVYPAELFYQVLAERLYHLQAAPETEVASDALVLAVGFTAAHEAGAARLAAWLARQPDPALVLLAPRGAELAAALRPHAVDAWSAGYWGGFNAFTLAHVEEAVRERGAERVYVAAADPAALLYTGIGAADTCQRALGGTAREAAARVRLLAFAAEAAPAGAPDTLLGLAKRHLEEVLGVASTAADARFRATGEAIAIDLV